MFFLFFTFPIGFSCVIFVLELNQVCQPFSLLGGNSRLTHQEEMKNEMKTHQEEMTKQVGRKYLLHSVGSDAVLLFQNALSSGKHIYNISVK